LTKQRGAGGVRALLAIDTNIVVRYLVGDDPEQFERATRVIESEEVWLSATVLLEAEWVLRSAYRRAPAEIVAVLRGFVRLPNVSVQNKSAALDALAWAEAGMDFADALHLAGAQEVEAFLSFDRDLAKQAKRLGAPPVREP
jgi:predicted nucleic acid-binding protein